MTELPPAPAGGAPSRSPATRPAVTGALVVGLAAILGAVLVIIGWATATSVLTRLAPAPQQMVAPWTAVLLGGVAASLIAHAHGARRAATVFAVVTIGLVAVLAVEGAVTGGNNVADALFPHSVTALRGHTGRPIPGALLLFALLGVALVVDPPRPIARWTVALPATLAAAGALGAICWHIFGADDELVVSRGRGVSLAISVLLFALALARLAQRPDLPPGSMLRRGTFGGQLARAVLPMIVFVPMVVGILVVTGPRERWWSIEFGAATLACIVVLVVVGGTLVAARSSDATTAALRASEQRFRLALTNAPIGVTLVSTEGVFLTTNPALREMFGYSDAELRASTFQELTYPEDLDADLELMRQTLAGEITDYRMEKRFLRADGTLMWALLSVGLVRDDDGEPLYFVSQLEDITERLESDAKFRHLALHDSLTGLPNRHLFMDRLEHALARRERDDVEVAVLYLDLDRFKVLNDSLGHFAGDEALVAAGERLGDLVRPGDTVARLGGDEFAVLCVDFADTASVVQVAERINRAVATAIAVRGRQVTLTASLGVAVAVAGDDPEALLRKSDLAMYQAKQRGRDRVEVFSDVLGAVARSRFEVEADLRTALADDQFVVHYQTQHDLESGEIVGAEALLRWAHPERGVVGPVSFLGVAQEAGLLGEIGDRTLCQALGDSQGWLAADAPRLGLSVNVTPGQVARPGFVEKTLTALAERDIPPVRLCLEMTETSLFAATSGAGRALEELAAHGVRLAVDDFGTGYASLATLVDLPISVLKIDRSFVHGLDQRAGDRAIVRTVLALATQLEVTVIAEGIETDGQRDRLRDLGCHFGQGFLYSKPTDARDFAAFRASVPPPTAASAI